MFARFLPFRHGPACQPASTPALCTPTQRAQPWINDLCSREGAFTCSTGSWDLQLHQLTDNSHCERFGHVVHAGQISLRWHAAARTALKSNSRWHAKFVYVCSFTWAIRRLCGGGVTCQLLVRSKMHMLYLLNTSRTPGSRASHV